MDGFYTAYFTGAIGSGFAVLVMREGIIIGADATGASYDGHFILNEKLGTYDGLVTITPQPGTALVTGASVGPVPVPIPIPIRIPVGFSSEDAIRMDTPTGPVNVSFHKIRGLA